MVHAFDTVFLNSSKIKPLFKSSYDMLHTLKKFKNTQLKKNQICVPNAKIEETLNQLIYQFNAAAYSSEEKTLYVLTNC